MFEIALEIKSNIFLEILQEVQILFPLFRLDNIFIYMFIRLIVCSYHADDINNIKYKLLLNYYNYKKKIIIK